MLLAWPMGWFVPQEVGLAHTHTNTLTRARKYVCICACSGIPEEPSGSRWRTLLSTINHTEKNSAENTLLP